MSGISTGLLCDAQPLSAERIKELETEVLTNGTTYAYLDEAAAPCFLLVDGVEGLKSLAWKYANCVTKITDSSYKKLVYKKTGLDQFKLDKTFIKTNLTDPWRLATVYEFDGNYEDMDFITGETDDGMTQTIVKVSDHILTADDVIGSTVTIKNADYESSAVITPDQVLTTERSNDGYTERECVVCNLPTSDPAFNLSDFCVCSVYAGPDDTQNGTYFTFVNEHTYVKSISCLLEDGSVIGAGWENVYKFDGSPEGRYSSQDFGGAYVKVSDKPLSESELLGSYVTIVAEEANTDALYYITLPPIQAGNILGRELRIEDSENSTAFGKITGVPYGDVPLFISLDMQQEYVHNNPTIPNDTPGTYFLATNLNDVFGSGAPGFVRSISCLTKDEAL